MAISITEELKTPLTEDGLLLKDSLMKRMVGVACNFLDCMKDPSLHDHIHWFHSHPMNRTSLHQLLIKSLALMHLPQHIMAEDSALAITDL